MAFDTSDLITALRDSRRNLLKHLEGMTDEQWRWKPYPECKSVRETLTHLLMGDRLLRYRLDGDPRAADFENVYIEVEAHYADFTSEQLVAEFESSHEEICGRLAKLFEGKPLDESFEVFGGAQKVEHYEIAAYGTLLALARQLGYDDAIPLLEETLGEEKETDRKLTELAEQGGKNEEAAQQR